MMRVCPDVDCTPPVYIETHRIDWGVIARNRQKYYWQIDRLSEKYVMLGG